MSPKPIEKMSKEELIQEVYRLDGLINVFENCVRQPSDRVESLLANDAYRLHDRVHTEDEKETE